jgi:hypothetical protein
VNDKTEVKPLKTIATMKAKNILMTLLLVTGAIAAKAAGYPPELALVSQPVMMYSSNSITVYYDVENIGDYTYRGNTYIYLDPDYGYYYAKKKIKVSPGNIKRIAIDIPLNRIDRGMHFTIMPYYELDDELYSFTTFEYFEPIRFYWNGPRTEPWVVITVPPLVSYYNRPSVYRYYYDGFRPPMPPPPGHGHGHGTPPPPMDPKHHTYNYHHNNGGYPANHFNEGTPPPAPHNNSSTEAPSATVRPKPNGGSMSSGHYNSGNNNSNPPAPNNGGASTRPKTNDPSSGRTGNSNNSGRVNSGSNSTGNIGSSSGRVGSSYSNSRPSGTNSSSGRTGNSSSNSRVNNSSSNSRSAATTGSSSSRSSSSTRSSSSSNGSSSSRSGSNNSSGSGRR